MTMINSSSAGYARLILFLLISILSAPASAELIFTAPPRENPAKGEEMYGPLSQLFSKILKQDVVYRHPENWLSYQNNMRAGLYDIVFDGPHFMAWRMAHDQHIPLAKLPGSLKFILVTTIDHKSINNVEDLIGKKICGLPPPNLATLNIYAQFPNPVRQPIFVGVRGGFAKVFSAFEKGRCDAAVFRTNFYQNKLSKEQRSWTKELITTTPLPNQGITVNSNKINPQQRQQLLAALRSEEGKQASRKLLDRFAKKADAFLPAKPEDYAGNQRFIEGVIYGW